MSKKNRNSHSLQPTKPSTKLINSTSTPKSDADQLPAVNYHWLLAIILGIFAILLYINTYKHGYVLDDQVAIIFNQNVQKGIKGIGGILKQDFWEFLNQKSGYYRPLPLITFAIEHQFFGNNPTVSHINNILLYGITTFLTFLLLQRWFRDTNQILLMLVILVFVSHPIHTEVVANIKSRDEILSTLFLIIMLFLFDIYQDSKKKKYLIMSLVSLYLAYLSKESSIVGLGLIGLVAYSFKKKNIGQAFLQIIPYVIISLLFFFQKKIMLGSLSGDLDKNSTVYPYFVDNTRFLSTFKLFAYYLKMLLLPYPLLHDYSYNQIPSGKITDIITIIGLLAFGGFILLIFKTLKHRNWLFFALAFIIITLSPGLLFVLSRGGIFAERFLYFPILGFSIFLVLGLDTIIKIKDEDTNSSFDILKRKPLIPIIFLCIIGLFSFETILRNNDWKDDFSLSKADFENGATNAAIQLHYANGHLEKYAIEKDIKLREDYFQKALKGYQNAISIFPLGESYFGMGRLYQLSNQPDSAKYYYKKTIRIARGYEAAYNNLALIFSNQGRHQLASYYLNLAIKANPNYQPAQTNKAIYLQNGLDIKVLPDSLKNEDISNKEVGFYPQ